MAEHQLNDANVDSVRKQSRCAFVTEVMPMKVDFPQLFSIPWLTAADSARLDSVSEEPQCVPRGLKTLLALTGL